ncbi:hypothetical protein MNBD_GAMMA08-1673 [hydrothermal vent metagenome]|uniref:Lipoprotein n=1 Tax=hydrothermal vent metagenome TaxID=652676 RepID=A0A3B0XCC2_9ZZZZ
MYIKKLWIAVIGVIFLFACSEKNIHERPQWLTNPGDGAVASCKTHVKGRYYQEELAIARARERLAARYGVEVSSIQNIKEKIINDKAYVRSNKEVLQSVTKVQVKTHVRKIWLDEKYDELWVWVYPVSNSDK